MGRGGGGGTGAVSFPPYIMTAHGDWVDHKGVDTITQSMVDTMNNAFGNSPWTSHSAYNPDADLSAMVASQTTFQALVTLLSSGTTLDSLVSKFLDDTYIDKVVTEFAADLDARLVSEILPRFERGMQDINAVSSSAFAIGRALIEENQDRQIAKLSADLHLKAAGDDALRLVQLKLEYQKIATQTMIELYRIKIVAKKEQTDVNMQIDEKDAVWDLEVFQFGANLLAAPGGGVATPKTPSQWQSAIGGGLSGAAAGGMLAAGTAMGGPVGAVIGGLLGAASSFL